MYLWSLDFKDIQVYAIVKASSSVFLNVLCRKCYLFLKLRSFKIQLIVTKVRITFYIKRYLKLDISRQLVQGHGRLLLVVTVSSVWDLSVGGDVSCACQRCGLELLRTLADQRHLGRARWPGVAAAVRVTLLNGSCCSMPLLAHEVLEGELLSPFSHSECSLLAGSVLGSR